MTMMLVMPMTRMMMMMTTMMMMMKTFGGEVENLDHHLESRVFLRGGIGTSPDIDTDDDDDDDDNYDDI